MKKIPKELYRLLDLLTTNQMRRIETGSKQWKDLFSAFNCIKSAPVESNDQAEDEIEQLRKERDELAAEVERYSERIKSLERRALSAVEALKGQ
jgi:uncharacterized coiled-coil DUF342 family protein